MNTQKRTAEFTRPADTTAYAAGDVVSNSTSAGAALNFSDIVRDNEQGIVLRVCAIKSGTGVSNSSLRLHLFKSDPGTVNDNAAFSLAYADRATYIGSLLLPDFSANGATAIAEAFPTLIMPVATADGGSGNIYGVLVAEAAYTPANGEQFSVTLYVAPEQE